MGKHELRAVSSLAAVFSVRLLGLFMIYPAFAVARERPHLAACAFLEGENVQNKIVHRMTGANGSARDSMRKVATGRE
jgi:hypothetical protein